MTTSAVRSVGRSKGVNVALWLVQGLLAVFFVLGAALPKLAGEAGMVELFDDIGVGQWFRYVVGGLELAGGVGLLVPRLAGVAALGLAGVMAGAVVTQTVALGTPAMVVLPLTLLAAALVVAWGRWPRTKALLDRR